MPIKEREGASVGGKVCSKRGPTLPSSTTTIPLVSRNGNEYAYLHSFITEKIKNNNNNIIKNEGEKKKRKREGEKKKGKKERKNIM